MRSKYQGCFTRGQTFGKWTVLSEELQRVYTNNQGYGPYGPTMQCSCGAVKIIEAARLLSGQTSSCKECVHGSFSNNPNWKGYDKVPGRYFNNLVRNAKKRNLEFDLTIEYLSDLFNSQRGLCADRKSVV